MILYDLIKSTEWLSVELTIIGLYPDIKNVIDEHKTVFEKLKLLKPESYEMEIVLTQYQDHYDDQTTEYVDVSGRKTDKFESHSYALEFTEWKKWLGMKLAKETVRDFTELEIISHCLHEMTFIDYEENEIQQQFDKLNSTIDEYKNLSKEEMKFKTITLEELIKKMNEKGNS